VSSGSGERAAAVLGVAADPSLPDP
jgi:hypothetical protein